MPTASSAPPSLTPPLLVIAIAIALSVAGGISALRLRSQMPNQAYLAIQSNFDTIERNAIRQFTPEARDANLLMQAAQQVVSLRAGKTPAPTAADILRQISAQSASAAIVRLSFAAVRLIELERAGASPGAYWPAVEVYLRGLETASFTHREPLFVDAMSRAYVAAAVPPGTANALASSRWRSPYAQFAQELAPRLQGLISERLRAGDAAAAHTCALILKNWLLQWAAESGRIGIRLTAADLLARACDDADFRAALQLQGGDELVTGAAGKLRQWRDSYRARARTIPAPSLMQLIEGADPSPAVHARLSSAVFIVGWFAAATGVCFVVACLLIWPYLSFGAGLVRSPRTWLAALAVVAISFVLVHLLPVVASGFVAEDLRREWSSIRYWQRGPILCAGVLGVSLLAAAVITRFPAPDRSTLLARLGAVASIAWPMLALCLLIATFIAGGVRQDYEQSIAASFQADSVAQIAGAGSRQLLDEARVALTSR